MIVPTSLTTLKKSANGCHDFDMMSEASLNIAGVAFGSGWERSAAFQAKASFIWMVLIYLSGKFRGSVPLKACEDKKLSSGAWINAVCGYVISIKITHA